MVTTFILLNRNLKTSKAKKLIIKHTLHFGQGFVLEWIQERFLWSEVIDLIHIANNSQFTGSCQL